jgi:hypothetical protein
MKSMTRKALVLMVVILAVATATTAATAFAGTKKKRIMVHEQVSDAIQVGSLAMLRLKMRAIRVQRRPAVAFVTRGGK